MWRPNNLQWLGLVLVALFIVATWPPSDGKSLAMKFVNWAVDPWDQLPVLPPQLGLVAAMTSRPSMRATRSFDSTTRSTWKVAGLAGGCG
jgi:hypothetical protein